MKRANNEDLGNEHTLFLTRDDLTREGKTKQIEDIEYYHMKTPLRELEMASFVIFFDGKRNKMLKDRYATI